MHNPSQPADDPPFRRILSGIDTIASDDELETSLDPEAKKLFGELRQLAKNLKSVDLLEFSESDFDVDSFLRRLDDTDHAAEVTEVISPADHSGSAPAKVRGKQRTAKFLGEYELFERLGKGGGGTVYRARHVKLKRDVAVKLLDGVDNPRTLARFDREMQAIGALHHPNIVTATDAREIDGVHFLVMEYVEGCDLSVLLKKCGPLPVAESCELIRQAAVGLQCIYENGLVHRDIKPGNLFLTKRGQLKILDLGLALLKDHSLSATGMTSSGVLMGTIDYMAPEQADNTHQVDIRADIYSLGATFFTLLSGKPPYSGPELTSPLQKIAAMASGRPPSIRLHCPNLPSPLIQTIDRMLAREPAERFATPAEVANAVSHYCLGVAVGDLLNPNYEQTVRAVDLQPQPNIISQERQRTPTKTRRWAWSIVAVLVVVALVASIVNWPNHQDKRPHPLSSPSPSPSPATASIAAEIPPATVTRFNTTREIAQWLLKSGGEVGGMFNGSWLRVKSLTQLPDTDFSIDGMNFPIGTSVSPEQLREVVGLPSLHSLLISFHQRFTVAHLEALEGCVNLETCQLGTLESSEIEDQHVAKLLKRMPRLTQLDLFAFALDGSCLDSIQKPERITRLTIGSPKPDVLKSQIPNISVSSIERMTRFTNLKSLYLPRVLLTRDHFMAIQKLSSVDDLKVFGPAEVADSIDLISEMSGLVNLNISDAAINDNQLLELTRCSKLTHLDVNFCPVSRAAVEQFRRALPHCEVVALLEVFAPLAESPSGQ